jgi:hypothetical protein
MACGDLDLSDLESDLSLSLILRCRLKLRFSCLRYRWQIVRAKFI